MLGDVGWQELLIVLVIVALIFGGSRVADLGSALGKGVREFRLGLKDDAEPEDASAPATDAAPSSRAESSHTESSHTESSHTESN